MKIYASKKEIEWYLFKKVEEWINDFNIASQHGGVTCINSFSFGCDDNIKCEICEIEKLSQGEFYNTDDEGAYHQDIDGIRKLCYREYSVFDAKSYVTKIYNQLKNENKE